MKCILHLAGPQGQSPVTQELLIKFISPFITFSRVYAGITKLSKGYAWQHEDKPVATIWIVFQFSPALCNNNVWIAVIFGVQAKSKWAFWLMGVWNVVGWSNTSLMSWVCEILATMPPQQKRWAISPLRQTLCAVMHKHNSKTSFII